MSKSSLFGVPNPFPSLFDNASFSIISHLIYCLQGEKLIPAGICRISYCRPHFQGGFSSASFLDFIMTDWKGSSLGIGCNTKHVMGVIAVCMLIDASEGKKKLLTVEKE